MSEDLFELVANVRRRGLPAALATVILARGSTPAKLTARMLIHFDGRIAGTIGGGCVEAEVIRAARDVIDTGRPRVMAFRLSGVEAERTGIACGGSLDIMIESLEDPRAILVGAGHVGQTTAALAARAGLRITVVDDRPDFASEIRFPSAAQLVVCELDQIGTMVTPSPRTPVLVMTRGHSEDYTVLKWALSTVATNIGVLGSRSKRIQFEAQLRAEGHSESDIARIAMPVGLDIGAETVEEIAVSIVGQLIQWRRQGSSARAGNG
ncbi:MAG TPA: XdhC/CoxI family protein [Planctomycetota bacterium]|nr:XdhC/CoxI family protein [Planctomycetota bacterium]